MKKVLSLFVLTLLIFTSCKEDKKEEVIELLNLGDFSFSESILTPNKAITITYKGDKPVDEESNYYYMVNSKAYPVDLNFSNNEAKIIIPDTAQAVAFNFKVDGKFLNNNNQGYLLPVHKNATETVVGNKAALANYAIGYGSEYDVKMSKDSAFSVIKDAITKHPELKEAWNTAFLRLALQNDKKSGEKLITDEIAALSSKPNLSEDDYSDIIRFYRMLRNKEATDSVSTLALEKFPNGKIAKNDFVNTFFDEKDLTKQETIYKDLKAKFKDLGNVENYILSTLARGHNAKGDKEQVMLYADKITDKSTKAGLFNSIAWPLAEKGENLDYAAELSKQSLDIMESSKNDLNNKPDYYTERQYKNSLDNSYGMYADTYALILFKEGKIKDAINYQKQAVDRDPSGEITDRYLQFLVADNQNELVLKTAEDYIKDNKAGAKAKDYFKQAYAKLNPKAKDVEEKLAAAEKVGYNKYKDEIKKGLIDEEAPQFTLKNLEGKEVSLASLKGKVTVLDFWATWCGPCKASFPAMQDVVTKYKDSDKVELLFIDTFERGATREKVVSDFIKKNKYTFNVLLDKEIKDSNGFEVAEKYDVSGIPTKVIIGPDGRMKYKSVGYSGSPSKVVKEIDIIVDVLMK